MKAFLYIFACRHAFPFKNPISFCTRLFSEVKNIEDQIYGEIRGRIKEADISAPLRKGDYYYYERTLEGKEYVQHCRRLLPNGDGAPPSVYDTMPTGHDAPCEHIILDENVNAQEHAYYSIGAFKVKFGFLICPSIEHFPAV